MADNVVKFRSDIEETGLERAKRKVRKHRFARVYRIGIIVLVVAGVLAAYFIYEKTKTFTSYSITNSVDYSLADGAKVVEFDGNILTYSKDGAGAVDSTGKLLWNQTFDMQNPLISMCGDTVAFADYGGSSIYVQTSDGESATVSTDMPIRKIRTSSSGYVVAVLEDTDVTWIYHYDMNGNENAYFRTTMEKSGYPLDLDISPDGELICVSYYYLDCDDVKSSVAFYDFGSVGQNYIDNYVSGYNYSDIMVPYVKFLDNETAIAVSSERMSVYAGAHKPVSVSDMFSSDEILSVYTGADAVAIVYRNSSSEAKYRLEIYDKTGKMTGSREFDFDYSNVTLKNNMVVLYGDRNIYIGSFDGTVKFEGTYEEDIHLIIPTVSIDKYIILTDSTIDTVAFK
jgi:hypothetical protein